MDDDKLVEEVARAICAVNKLSPDNCFIKKGVKIPQWRKFEDEARAALAVIRPAVIKECAKVADEFGEAERDELRVQRNDAMAAVMRAIGFWQQAEAERDALRAWVNTIAAQKLEGEMEDDDERENADYQGAYDKIVEEARSLVSVRIDSALKEGDGA